jgi:hypothetical protein
MPPPTAAPIQLPLPLVAPPAVLPVMGPPLSPGQMWGGLSPTRCRSARSKFPLDQPAPVELVRAMARYRAEENLRRERRRGKG